MVPAMINNVLELEFILDSGAADVTIPADVVRTLMRTGSLTAQDFRETRTYVIADGSQVRSRTFLLKSIRVGNRVAENVLASEAQLNGPLLLGQSFLNKFASWSLDNVTQTLKLD